jgi:membrane protease YdiL (CAAX protease family)
MDVLLDQKVELISPFEAGLVITLTFFLTAIVGAILLLTFGYGPTLVLGELLILAIPLGYLISKRVDVKSFVGINFKPKFLLIGVGCGGILILLNIIISGMLTYIFGNSQAVEQSNALLKNLSLTPSGLIIAAASLALAGICEEFAFRGFLQKTLTKRYSFVPAIVISAAVFGIFHFDPQVVYTLAAFLSGLFLGYTYYRWNYITAATAHLVMNLIVLAVIILGL